MTALLLLTGAGASPVPVPDPVPTPSGAVRQVLNGTAHAASVFGATGTQRAGMAARTKHYSPVDVIDPVFMWRVTNLGVGISTSSTATLRAAVWTDADPAPVAVTFGGATSATVPLSGDVTSDPVDVQWLAGASVTLHVWVAADAETGYTPGTAQTAPGHDPGRAVGTYAETLAATPTDGTFPALRPVGVYAPSTADSWLMVGDSIANHGNGWLDQSSRALQWASTKVAVGGEGFLHYPGRFAERFGGIIGNYTHVLCEHGVNDMAQTLATIQGNAIAFWNSLIAGGPATVWQSTATPLTTSANVHLSTAVRRVEWNQWLRDGAPMSGGVAVAVGAAGALRAGAAGHPLKGVLDICPAVETGTDTGYWKTGMVGDGTHPHDSAHLAIKDLVVVQMASA